MKLSIITVLAAAALASASAIPICNQNTDAVDINEVTFHTIPLICRPKCYPERPFCHFGYKPKLVIKPDCWKCCKRHHEGEFEEFDDEGFIDDIDA